MPLQGEGPSHMGMSEGPRPALVDDGRSRFEEALASMEALLTNCAQRDHRLKTVEHSLTELEARLATGAEQPGPVAGEQHWGELRELHEKACQRLHDHSDTLLRTVDLLRADVQDALEKAALRESQREAQTAAAFGALYVNMDKCLAACSLATGRQGLGSGSTSELGPSRCASVDSERSASAEPRRFASNVKSLAARLGSARVEPGDGIDGGPRAEAQGRAGGGRPDALRGKLAETGRAAGPEVSLESLSVGLRVDELQRRSEALEEQLGQLRGQLSDLAARLDSLGSGAAGTGQERLAGAAQQAAAHAEHTEVVCSSHVLLTSRVADAATRMSAELLGAAEQQAADALAGWRASQAVGPWAPDLAASIASPASGPPSSPERTTPRLARQERERLSSESTPAARRPAVYLVPHVAAWERSLRSSHPPPPASRTQGRSGRPQRSQSSPRLA